MMSHRAIQSEEPARRELLERRFFPRIEVELPARIAAPVTFERVRVTNLSVGGCLAELPACATQLVRGDELDLEIELRGGAVRAKAVVVWWRTEPPPSVALEFGALDEADLVRLQALIDAEDPIAWSEAGETTALPTELAAAYLPVVRRFANHVGRGLPSHVSRDDLVGAGFVGLVEAHRRWPFRHGDGFERYALVCIRGAMLDEMRAQDPLSRRERGRYRRIERASGRLWADLGRRPTDDEVAEYLGVSRTHYDACVATVAAARKNTFTEAECDVADPNVRGPDEAFDHEQAHERLHIALNALPDRLRRVLHMHYGDELTLREIGNLLGVTQSRICQIVKHAVGLLRDNLGVEAGVPPSGADVLRARGSA